jgi:hypothetical protein
MSSPSILCAAIVVWLSTTAVDEANAKGTFRLQGPWPSVSMANLSAHDIVGGCGRGRTRDPHTHSCRGPADIR